MWIEIKYSRGGFNLLLVLIYSLNLFHATFGQLINETGSSIQGLTESGGLVDQSEPVTKPPNSVGLSFVCPLVDSGYFPDTSTNCRIFYFCHQNVKLRFECPTNFSFDVVSNGCQDEKVTVCAKDTLYKQPLNNTLLGSVLNNISQGTEEQVTIPPSSPTFFSIFSSSFASSSPSSSKLEDTSSHIQLSHTDLDNSNRSRSTLPTQTTNYYVRAITTDIWSAPVNEVATPITLITENESSSLVKTEVDNEVIVDIKSNEVILKELTVGENYTSFKAITKNSTTTSSSVKEGEFGIINTTTVARPDSDLVDSSSNDQATFASQEPSLPEESTQLTWQINVLPEEEESEEEEPDEELGEEGGADESSTTTEVSIVFTREPKTNEANIEAWTGIQIDSSENDKNLVTVKNTIENESVTSIITVTNDSEPDVNANVSSVQVVKTSNPVKNVEFLDVINITSEIIIDKQTEGEQVIKDETNVTTPTSDITKSIIINFIDRRMETGVNVSEQLEIYKNGTFRAQRSEENIQQSKQIMNNEPCTTILTISNISKVTESIPSEVNVAEEQIQTTQNTDQITRDNLTRDSIPMNLSSYIIPTESRTLENISYIISETVYATSTHAGVSLNINRKSEELSPSLASVENFDLYLTTVSIRKEDDYESLTVQVLLSSPSNITHVTEADDKLNLTTSSIINIEPLKIDVEDDLGNHISTVIIPTILNVVGSYNVKGEEVTNQNDSYTLISQPHPYVNISSASSEIPNEEKSSQQSLDQVRSQTSNTPNSTVQSSDDLEKGAHKIDPKTNQSTISAVSIDTQTSYRASNESVTKQGLLDLVEILKLSKGSIQNSELGDGFKSVKKTKSSKYLDNKTDLDSEFTNLVKNVPRLERVAPKHRSYGKRGKKKHGRRKKSKKHGKKSKGKRKNGHKSRGYPRKVKETTLATVTQATVAKQSSEQAKVDDKLPQIQPVKESIKYDSGPFLQPESMETDYQTNKNGSTEGKQSKKNTRKLAKVVNITSTNDSIVMAQSVKGEGEKFAIDYEMEYKKLKDVKRYLDTFRKDPIKFYLLQHQKMCLYSIGYGKGEGSKGYSSNYPNLSLVSNDTKGDITNTLHKLDTIAVEREAWPPSYKNMDTNKIYKDSDISDLIRSSGAKNDIAKAMDTDPINEIMKSREGDAKNK